MTTGEVKTLLGKKPREKLGFFPTPFYRLENLSADLGINLFIKRDDLSGPAALGGNKVRKLEYLLGEAKKQGAEYVFTYGATQSNHGMLTALCAGKAGLKAVLYLAALVAPDEGDPKANLLLDKILGAEIHIIRPNPGEGEPDLMRRAMAAGKEQIGTLEKSGHRCFDIPPGGASPVGVAGYIDGFIELQGQARDAGFLAEYLFHANGTGGTMAGLLAGKKLTGSPVKIISVDVSARAEDFKASRAALGNEALAWLGAEGLLSAADVENDSDYYHPGYEKPSELASEAIKMVSAREGVYLDPVYSGKGFSALIGHVRRGKIPRGSNVVFLHTGGVTALFAEKEIRGDLG